MLLLCVWLAESVWLDVSACETVVVALAVSVAVPLPVTEDVCVMLEERVWLDVDVGDAV